MTELPTATFAEYIERCVDLCSPSHALPSESIEDTADRLRRAGVASGDLILIALPNGKALLHFYWAVMTSGAVPGLIPPDSPATRLAELVSKTGARGCIGRQNTRPASDAVGNMEIGCWRLQLFNADAATTSGGEAVLMTSGTSGFSSGCVFDFRSLLANARKHVNSIGQRADDVVLVNLPLYYSFAFVAQMLGSLVAGSRIVLAPSPFNPREYCRAISEQGVSVSSLTPTLVRSLLAAASPPPSHLRILTVGGDVLSKRHVEGLLRQSTARELYITYGLTQAGPRVTTFAAHCEPSRRWGSAGLPLKEVQVALRPRENHVGEGELLVASDTLMKRRIGSLEGRGDQDWAEPGVLATGDIFTLDDDGYLYYRGRKSEFVVFNGEKVSLASIRRVANGLPGVIRASVEHRKSALGADEIEVVLEMTDDSHLSEETAMNSLRQRLRPAERPTKVRIQAGATQRHK